MKERTFSSLASGEIATARKLAVIIWNILVKKAPYHPVVPAEYADKIRQQQVKQIQRKIRQLNIQEDELTFVAA